MTQAETIETSVCRECGADTLKNGYVNRVSYGGDVLDAWQCGRCEEAWENSQVWWDIKNKKIVGRGEDEDPRFDGEGEEIENADSLFERSTDDEMYEKYEKERWAEVDAQFPDAPRFRELSVIVEGFGGTKTDEKFDEAVEELRTLVKNYRYNEDVPNGSWNTAGGVLENLLR